MKYDDIDLNKTGTNMSINSFENAVSDLESLIGAIEANKFLLGATPDPGYIASRFGGASPQSGEQNSFSNIINQQNTPEATAQVAGNNQAKVWNYLRQVGFTPQAIAGIMGNLMQESTPNINPRMLQAGGGPGRGIMQWTVDQRWQGLIRWASTRRRDIWDLYTQLDFMLHEMEGNFRKTRGGPDIVDGSTVYTPVRKIKDNFFKITNVRIATIYFEISMERAGRPMMEKRFAYAEQVLQKFGRS